ncbi:MAG: patatin-like phospholipase family protein [Kiritimatiellia bacterium]
MSKSGNNRKTMKTGLALGSGGARGWAHIGVLLELKKMGFEPFCIAGTSIGSIAGALYATDTLELAEDLALHLNWKQVAQLFLEVNFLRSGLVSGKNFMRLLKDVIPARSFDELQYPLAIVATDLNTEKEVVFRDGDLMNAIRSSISIPGIFTPVEYKHTHLVDGGLVNPLPISVCHSMGADKVIAVDINLKTPSVSEKKPVSRKKTGDTVYEEKTTNIIMDLKVSVSKLLPQLQTPVSETFQRWFDTREKPHESLSIMDVLTRSFRLGENEITRSTIRLNPPEVLIQPEVGDIMTLEFYRGKETIEAGQQAVRNKKEELEALIQG